MLFINNTLDKDVVFLTLYAAHMQHTPLHRVVLTTCIAAALLSNVTSVSASTKAEVTFGDWYRYAMHQLAPEISVSLGVTTVSDGQAALVQRRALLPATPANWLGQAFGTGSMLSANIEHSSVSVGTQPALRTTGAALVNSGLQRSITSPGVVAAFSNGSNIRVGAVFAQQQFLSGIGQQRVDLYNPLASAVVRSEVSSGSAIRVGFDQHLGDAALIALDYQSRVDMDSFQRLRGLYSEPGDFDVPATVSMGVSVNPTARATVGVGVDRLLYSDVPAFTSNALPNRLLSLLGDSTSPSFEWRDLTVYRANVSVKTSDDAAVRVTYATRLQPLPTSVALRGALSQASAARNVVVGFDQGLGDGAAFSVAATYSPSQYFLGPRVGSNDSTGKLLELQAVWRLEF